MKTAASYISPAIREVVCRDTLVNRVYQAKAWEEGTTYVELLEAMVVTLSQDRLATQRAQVEAVEKGLRCYPQPRGFLL